MPNITVTHGKRLLITAAKIWRYLNTVNKRYGCGNFCCSVLTLHSQFSKNTKSPCTRRCNAVAHAHVRAALARSRITRNHTKNTIVRDTGRIFYSSEGHDGPRTRGQYPVQFIYRGGTTLSRYRTVNGKRYRQFLKTARQLNGSGKWQPKTMVSKRCEFPQVFTAVITAIKLPRRIFFSKCSRNTCGEDVDPALVRCVATTGFAVSTPTARQQDKHVNIRMRMQIEEQVCADDGDCFDNCFGLVSTKLTKVKPCPNVRFPAKRRQKDVVFSTRKTHCHTSRAFKETLAPERSMHSPP